MGFRDRLRRAQRAAEEHLDTFGCAGCGETFKVSAEAWMNLLVCEWAEEAREWGSISEAELLLAEALRGRGVEELERHARHGEIYEPEGPRAWPPAWGAV